MSGSRSARVRRGVTLGVLALLVLAACDSTNGDARRLRPVTLRVGLLYTTGGRGGDLASAVLGAAKLAVDAAARDRVTIEIAEADYAGNLRQVPGSLRQLAGKSDAVVVGTDDPDIAPLLAGFEDTPILHAFVAADGIVEDREAVFRFAPSNRLQAQKIAEYLVEHRKYRRIALVTDTTRFGREGAGDLAAMFAESEVAPVLERSFDPGGDIHTIVAEAGQKSVDAMVIWVESPGEAARIVVEAHRVGFAYQFVLSGNLGTATFAKNASAQVTPVAFRDGILSVGTWAGPWFRLERILRFYSDFRTENSALAPVQAAAVYDAILALARAARDKGTAPADLVAGLESLEDFEAAGVPVTFGADKHEGVDLDDLAILGFTKSQDSAGGDFFPEVDTGGGFFTIVMESLELPKKYRFLATQV